MKKINAWKLFENFFKPGDEIIAITDDDLFMWGKLISWNDNFFLLSNFKGEEEEITWERISFMCHDGFPVRKLRGADGGGSILLEDASKVIEAVRKALVEENKDRIDKKEALISEINMLSISGQNITQEAQNIKSRLGSKSELNYPGPPKKIIFRHPFEAKGVRMELFNPKNSGPLYRDSPFIETLVLYGADGSAAHLWDLESLFYAE